MAKNDFAEDARRAQDLDVPAITIPEGAHHTGRGTRDQPRGFLSMKTRGTNVITGGAANTYTPTETEQREARAHNEKVRSESFNRSGSKERGNIRALADKAKDAITGRLSMSSDKSG